MQHFSVSFSSGIKLQRSFDGDSETRRQGLLQSIEGVIVGSSVGNFVASFLSQIVGKAVAVLLGVAVGE